jgi:glycosyltransferase involved in cell wall biosynthesis
MRVHLVSEHASPLAVLGGVDAGGQNVHVAALATHLARLGCDVVVHTRRDDPALPRRVRFNDCVTVDHVDAGPAEPVAKDELLPYMGAFADDLDRQWQHDRPDVVHAHFWMSGVATVDAAERHGIPTALTFHALGIDKRRFQGAADTSPDERVDIEAWLARRVDRVIATTASERDTLIGFGADPGRVSVIPCGVDVARFRAKPQATQRSQRILCISRLVPRKGLADVIRAVVLLPDVELVIAGGPPRAMLTDDPYACELMLLAEELAVADRVRLVGAVDPGEVPELMRTASLVCCAPWYEPFGIVAVEAMACGIPVIATSVGGLAESVIDGVTGLHVPPRQPEAIAAAVRTLLDVPATRSQMGAAAVRHASRFDWPRVAARTAQVLRNVECHDFVESAPPSVRSLRPLHALDGSQR